jgi:hypothetical protein
VSLAAWPQHERKSRRGKHIGLLLPGGRAKVLLSC